MPVISLLAIGCLKGDLQTLRDAGLSDAKIFYVIEMAAMYNFTDRVMSAYGMRPDEEFMPQISPREGERK